METQGLPTGTQIDAYVVERLLGRGGMASVYLVRQSALGSVHAFKILDVPSRNIRERLKQEGRLQASMRHPNIVKVERFVVFEGCPGLILEYVDGPDLDALLAMRRLTVPQIDVIATGILRGVRAAHRQGTVHRDLKPANVLLARTEEGLVPKVSDFGMAKVLDHQLDGAATKSGQALGTPAYMAPEQFRDAKNADQRADVWALGCIFHEMLTGERPFPQEAFYELFEAVTQGSPPALPDDLADVPDRMRRAVAGSLVTDPAQRIPDVDTLLAVWRGPIRDWRSERVPEASHAFSEAPVASPHADVDEGPGRDGDTAGGRVAADIAIADDELAHYRHAAAAGTPSTFHVDLSSDGPPASHEAARAASAPSMGASLGDTRGLVVGALGITGLAAFAGGVVVMSVLLLAALYLWPSPAEPSTELEAHLAGRATPWVLGRASVVPVGVDEAVALAVQLALDDLLESTAHLDPRPLASAPTEPGDVASELDAVLVAHVGRAGDGYLLNLQRYDHASETWATHRTVRSDDVPTLLDELEPVLTRVLIAPGDPVLPVATDTLDALRAELDACVPTLPSGSVPPSPHRVVATWAIPPSGRMAAVDIRGAEPGDDELVACLKERLRSRLLPAGTEGDGSWSHTFAPAAAPMPSAEPAPRPSPRASTGTLRVQV